MRTAGSNVGAPELTQDFRYLRTLWDAVKNTVMNTPAPALVYREGDLVLRAVRDIFTDDMTACIIDDEKAFQRVREFTRVLLPDAVDKIKFFDSRDPVFDHFGIEQEVTNLSQQKIPLPKGASIVIDQTEASRCDRC
ncbi:MAG: ribonuclease E/G [Planctomycetota bacterium]|nr:ribonuclease E/G [Planctomycetota bacterium]